MMRHRSQYFIDAIERDRWPIIAVRIVLNRQEKSEVPAAHQPHRGNRQADRRGRCLVQLAFATATIRLVNPLHVAADEFLTQAADFH